MEALSIYLTHIIVSLGGFGVFLASVIEEIIIPIPSTLVHSGAGLFLLGGTPFSFAGVMKLIVLVALPSALGVALGSLFVYGITFYGGVYALQRYGKYVGLPPSRVEKARSTIVGYRNFRTMITVLRFIPLFPNVCVTAVCGVLRVPLKEYLVTTAIGIFIRALYLGAIGWFSARVAHQSATMDTFFGRMGILVLILVAVSFVTSVVVARIYKKSS